MQYPEPNDEPRHARFDSQQITPSTRRNIRPKLHLCPKAGGMRNDPRELLNPMIRTIYQASDFIVRFVQAGDADSCVITFSSFTDDPRLDRPGFGETFLRDQGVDAIHVVNRTNVWYHYEEMPEALEAIAAIASNYSRVFTYGSSMGGYAAIRHAEAVGAGIAIALSPQYSIFPKLVPFEDRWRQLAKNIDFDGGNSHGSQSTKPIIFYDPYDQDRQHVELIERAYPRTSAIRLPNAGHPVGAFLSETGLLKKAIVEIIAGTFAPESFEARAGKKRRHSGQYLFTLARRLPPRLGALKRELVTSAASIHEDAAYLIYLSCLQEAVKDQAGAEKSIRRAGTALRDHPIPIRALGRFLLRGRRYGEAEAIFEHLLTLDPERREYRRLLIGTLIHRRLFERAAALMRQDLEIRHRHASAPWSQAFAAARYLVIGARQLEMFRPVLLARLQRQIRIDKEMDSIEEWRHRRKRLRQPNFRVSLIAVLESTVSAFVSKHSWNNRKSENRST